MKLILPLLILFFSGCCPVLYAVHPGFSGKILNADDETPLAGATVNLKDAALSEEASDYLICSTKTKTDGSFHIKAPKKIGVYMMPASALPVQYEYSSYLLELVYENSTIQLFRCQHSGLHSKHFYDLNEIKCEPSNNLDQEEAAEVEQGQSSLRGVPRR